MVFWTNQLAYIAMASPNFNESVENGRMEGVEKTNNFKFKWKICIILFSSIKVLKMYIIQTFELHVYSIKASL